MTYGLELEHQYYRIKWDHSSVVSNKAALSQRDERSQAIRKRDSTSRLRDPVQLSHASIVLTDPLLFRMAAVPFGYIHEGSGSVPHDQTKEPKASVLLHHANQNHLSTNTIIMPASSCVEGKSI